MENQTKLLGVAEVIRDCRTLSGDDIEILCQSLKGEDMLKEALLTIIDDHKRGGDKYDYMWLNRVLNDYFSFSPLWDENRISGFEITRRSRIMENHIYDLAERLSGANENE